ncbi:predicted protein [Histoplasma mississippiense (nom. inval.)]|uniref:predicted protein n=1 Tax=Ajellomyces capsulatus (strain NAm1 / WU24) TaxID=2059318 RepID=UPI000157CFDF|nr:predicted protein [Histoplasma mississippiense (nom. inval.)]EDN10999.1 predicted protein [Histoplasma mississippiense (nom. inval.)]
MRSDDDQLAELEEQARKQEEKEMEDSGEVDGEEADREIDHLILVTHGIGQRLGLRLDSINFVHDVNVLRKTMKSVYAASPDLQVLNSHVDSELKNCRVQVLPVCWRHLLDFPQQGLKQHRKELDLADADKMAVEDAHYPSLKDITLEGVPAVRNLITDLAMDVLLYQSTYREHIAGIVQRECNRIYKLFKVRNPRFKGSMLKGKRIVGKDLKIMDSTQPPGFITSVSSPKCGQLFNIFHPSDPISYRIEPLISPAMTALKPQPLPYVKRTIWSTSGQSLTNISTRVGQSVGSLWTHFASGVASSFLNRSLGLSEASTQPRLAVGERQKITGSRTELDIDQSQAIDMGAVVNESSPSHQKYPTLIDANIETLYDGFQKTRNSSIDIAIESESSIGIENRARNIRHEEEKVRALNSNGRVDYSIQD